jgi:hypothetical protein
MFRSKYLIIIGVIICLLVFYYFYDEISKIKKMFLPTYQKTRLLEEKMLLLENKSNEVSKKKLFNVKNDSPALSITYQSDMYKNGNLSIKCVDVTDTEANELLKSIRENNLKTKMRPQVNNTNLAGDFWNRPNEISNVNAVPKHEPNLQFNNISNQNCIKNTIKSDEISDFKSISNNSMIPVKNDIFGEETDIINVKISDIIRKNPIDKKHNNNSEKEEYKKPYRTQSEDFFDENTELDENVIKNISESIQRADLHSDTILSDIPVIINRSKKSNKRNIRNNNKK